jgi:hypothetical protein
MADIVPTGQKELTAWTPPPGGWASDGNEDIPPAFPIVSIVQPMSQIAMPVPGWWYHSDTGEQTGEFVGVLLVRRETRAMFVKGDDKPICRSDDGKVPVARTRLWEMEPGDRLAFENGENYGVPLKPKDCDDCPFSVWRGSDPPLCGNSYIIIAARNGDQDDLVQVRLKGTSIKPFRQWIRTKLAPKREPMYFYEVRLTTEEKQAPSRKWHQLVIEANPLTEAEAQQYSIILGEHRARIEHAVREAGGEVEQWIDPDGAEDMPFE